MQRTEKAATVKTIGRTATMKQFLLMSIILVCISLTALKCKDEPTKPHQPQIQLTFEDASCTEVWLKLSVANVSNPIVMLKRDDTAIDTLYLTTADTTIIDENLLPSHTYTYTVQLVNQLTNTCSTSARTMDTTSHNFTWQTFTLGDGSGSSTLYDVAIINDTLAYACGAVYSGGFICNLAKWNGKQWDTLHISVTLTYTSSQMVTDQDPLKTIYAFNENDIWVVSQAGGVSHWNGTQWIMLSIPFNQGPGACNKMWGTSSLDLYFVGNNGRIIHYNGSSWTKIESGTDLQFLDIFGATDQRTGEKQILAVCTQNYPGNRGIFSIKGNIATQISSYPIQWELFSVWFVPNRHYYVVGGDYYEKSFLRDTIWKNFNPPTHYGASQIRGNAINDAIVVGAYGECLHWNGVGWNSYRDMVAINGSYSSVAVKGNLVIAVGSNNAQAAIAIGRR
jgi:hypothetical protein